MSSQHPAWSNQAKLIVVLVALAITAYLLHRFSGMLPPLILGAILAYVMSPGVNILQRKLKLPRILAILLTYLLVFLVIGGVLSQFVPMLLRQGSDIGEDIRYDLSQINNFLGGHYVIWGYYIDGRMLINQFSGSINSLLEPVFGSTISLVRGIVSSLAWVIFIIVISIYLIKDKDQLSGWIESLVPPASRSDFLEIRSEIGTIWSSFFRGQLILALLVTVVITGVALAEGLRFALLMGVLAGLLEFIPSLGHGIWLLVALPLALFGGSSWIPIPGWMFALIVLAVHIVFENVDANYLIPRIIGRSVRLPPLVVILGIVAGASLAGVLGVMLAAPTIASLRVIGRYIYAQMVNVEPFPNDISAPLPKPSPLWWRRANRPLRKPAGTK